MNLKSLNLYTLRDILIQWMTKMLHAPSLKQSKVKTYISKRIEHLESMETICFERSCDDSLVSADRMQYRKYAEECNVRRRELESFPDFVPSKKE